MALPSALTQYPTPFEGKLIPSAYQRIIARVNAEASALIIPGRLVQENATGNGVLNLTAANNLLAGIVIHEHSFVRDVETVLSPAPGGVNPGKMMSVLEAGEIYVITDEAVTPADPVRFRISAAGGGLGTFRKTAAAGLTVLASRWRYRWAAAANTRVALAFDVRDGVFTAD
jgi:hypothetical protein